MKKPGTKKSWEEYFKIVLFDLVVSSAGVSGGLLDYT
jgi:hypothetical protein